MIGKKINQLATELAPVSTDLTIIGDPTTGVSKKITLAQLGAIFSGAVSFYTNYAAFPTPGTTDVIYCAKDTQKLYLWSGSAYVEVFPSQALLDTYQLRSEKGNANGYASLDSQGKVPISQLPSSIMEYKGTWNASTNTPTLANGTGDTGDVYICNVAGTVNFGAGPLTFAVGDYVIYSGTIWQRSSGAVGTVTSVAATITGDAIGITGSPITTSGTLALAFAGTSGQYINGAGSLTTFPSLTGFVPYTGATGQVNLGAYDLLVQTLTIGKGNSGLSNNTALGYRTLFHITTGNYNTAVGYEAAHNTTTGQYNTALGQSALFTNTTGSQNTALGLNALLYNLTGGSNVVVGLDAMQHNTTGSSNTALGYNAGSHITGGSTPNTTASNSVYIGRDSKAKVDGGANEIVIGYNAIGNGSNTATFGNTSTTANYFTGSINGGSFVKSGGTSTQFLKADGSVDSNTYVTTDTFQTISASKTFSVGLSLASAGGTNQITSFVNTNSIHSGSTATNVLGFNNSNNIYFGKGLNNGGVITFNNAAVRFYALPDADGTIALVGGSGVGTVTSVSALTIGTSGTDLSSTVANSTTTPVITLNVPTASATNRGALSSADWTTFNNKQNALTNPVTGTGTTNYLSKFTGTSTIGNSLVYDNGSSVGIGTTSPGAKLDVVGSGRFSAPVQINSNIAGLILNRDAVTNYNGISYLTASVGQWFVGMRENLSSNNYIIYNESGSDALTISKSNNAATFSANSNSTITNSFQNTNTTDTNSRNIFNVIAGNVTTSIQSIHNDHSYINVTNNLYLQSGGGVKMTMLSSGNVGIGSTSPNKKLEVVTGNGTTDGIRLTYASGITTEGMDITYLNTGQTTTSFDSLYNSNSAVMQFRMKTNGAPLTAMTILGSGNIGIGTTSPTDKFVVSNGGANTLHFDVEFSGGASTIYSYNRSTSAYTNLQLSASNIIFQSGGTTERMRITSGGDVCIGTTSGLLSATNRGNLTINGSSNSILTFGIAGAYSGYVFSGSSNFELDAQGSRFMQFNTNGQERMRITSDGKLCVATSSAYGGALSVANISGNWAISIRDIQSNEALIQFTNSSGTEVGSITRSGTSTAYNTSSDYRLKQDLKDFNGLDLVNKIKTYDYEWKSDKTRSYGVIAHELQSVINYAVRGVKDGKEMQGVDYSKIVPVLIKSIQELKQELDTLKNK